MLYLHVLYVVCFMYVRYFLVILMPMGLVYTLLKVAFIC